MTYMKKLVLWCYAIISTTMYGMNYQLQEDEVEVDVDCGSYCVKAIAKKPRPNIDSTAWFENLAAKERRSLVDEDMVRRYECAKFAQDRSEEFIRNSKSVFETKSLTEQTTTIIQLRSSLATAKETLIKHKQKLEKYITCGEKGGKIYELEKKISFLEHSIGVMQAQDDAFRSAYAITMYEQWRTCPDLASKIAYIPTLNDLHARLVSIPEAKDLLCVCNKVLVLSLSCVVEDLEAAGKQTIVKLGTDPLQSSEVCKILFQAAVVCSEHKIVKLLLGHLNDPSFADACLAGLLMAACNNNIEIMQLFFNHKGYLEANHRKELLCQSMVEALNTKHYDVVQAYLEQNIETPEKFFHSVIASGQLNLVKTMVLKGANFSERSNDGLLPDQIPTTPEVQAYLTSTPLYTQRLMRAIEHENYQEFITCLNHNAQLTWRDSEGNTPLHRAAQHGHLKMIADLLAHGADQTALNNAGQNPVAMVANNPGCLDIFSHAVLNDQAKEIFDRLARLDEHAQQHNRIRTALMATAKRIGKYITLSVGIGLGGLTLNKVMQTYKNIGFNSACRQVLGWAGITSILCNLLYRYSPKVINRLLETKRTQQVRTQLSADDQAIRQSIITLRADAKTAEERSYIQTKLAEFNRLDNGQCLQTEHAQRKYAEVVAHFNS